MSLPERDEDFLRQITESLNGSPSRDLPGDDADNYIPEVTIKTVPKRLYEDTIVDLRDEIEQYRDDNIRLATERNDALESGNRFLAEVNRLTASNLDLMTRFIHADSERKQAINDAGDITALYNHQININRGLATERRALERRLFVWRCVAVIAAATGWAAFVVAVLLGR